MNKKTYMLPGDERIVAGNAEEFVHELRVAAGWIPTVPTSSICTILPNVMWCRLG